ncbi:hypothetical protein VB711_24255 [Cronbergia sp. UHCC 0137]|uniref:PFE-CTERM domain-containing protein n=1 Tax=Cronbergia sp. UHCC 0137 TaxID=3110239 RepID=UPI002B207470|nr:hypothetical protein [Cronbergia sp. UHCC 0137]MEA5620926.1 hypothetical protein [Cronbergia sp. UHCC 0137]
MKLATRLGIATVGIALTMTLTEIKPAQALLWNWSFNGGDEAGTFETNGTFADTAGSSSFRVDPSTFNVTASAFAPSLVGANFDTPETQSSGIQFFAWDGTTVTTFARIRGTPGFNVFESSDFVYSFTTSPSPIGRLTNRLTFETTGSQPLTLTPIAPTPVPFDFSPNLGLGLIGAYAVGKIALKKIKPSKTPINA